MADELKERIKDVAFKAFMEKGFKAVTMEQISKELGISKKTLYNYFNSKDELAEEFLRDFFKKLRENSDKAAMQEEDPQKRLWIKLQAVKEEYLKINPLFFEDIQKYAVPVWETYRRLREERAKNLEQYIALGQEKGVFKEIPPKMAVVLYLGMTNSLFRTDFLEGSDLTREKAFDMIIEMFICGLLKADKRP